MFAQSPPGGKPDLSGFYDSGTLTPLNRPEYFGDKQFMTQEEAAEIVERQQAGLAGANQASDPNRGAPVAGGDGNIGGGISFYTLKPGRRGGVGGCNVFWIDSGKLRLRDRRQVPHVHHPRSAERPAAADDREGKEAQGAELRELRLRERRHRFLAGEARAGAVRRARDPGARRNAACSASVPGRRASPATATTSSASCKPRIT